MKRIVLSILLVLFSINLTFADSNGVWHFAKDIRGGIFGSDEQNATSNFSFINNVYFNQTLFSKNIQALNLEGISFKTNNGMTRLSISNNGNIGIGTKIPQSLLDVNGTIRAKEICDENGKNCQDLSDLDSGIGGGILIANDVECNLANEGVVNYDADAYESTLQYCNGVRWIILSKEPKLPASCKEILEQGSSTGTGMYEIDPDGVGGINSFDVYCDMTHQGGGWTLYANHKDNTNPAIISLVTPSNYGVLGAAKWRAVRDNMEVGMMFIDEDDKITTMSASTLLGGSCLPIDELDSLLDVDGGGAIWRDENYGCLNGGEDYSVIHLYNPPHYYNAGGVSLYQWSSEKFDIWTYPSSRTSNNEELLYYIK